MPYGVPRSGNERVVRHGSIYGRTSSVPSERQYQNQSAVVPEAVTDSAEIVSILTHPYVTPGGNIQIRAKIKGICPPLCKAEVRMKVTDPYGSVEYKPSPPGKEDLGNGEEKIFSVMFGVSTSEPTGSILTYKIEAQEQNVGLLWNTTDTDSVDIEVRETVPAQPLELEQYIVPAMTGAGAGAVIGLLFGGKAAAIEFAAIGAAAYAGYSYMTKPEEV